MGDYNFEEEYDLSELQEGDRVRFHTPRQERRWWWTVRSLNDRFIVLTRQAPFKRKGIPIYTIIDLKAGLRGPCNRIGQGWDCSTQEGCDDLLAELSANTVTVSRRNYVETCLKDVDPIDPLPLLEEYEGSLLG